MSPGDFLRSIWPSVGHYCLAKPFIIPGTNRQSYAHTVFPTIKLAVEHVLANRNGQDTFFAVLSLAEAQVWNEEKVHWKTGLKGAYEKRTKGNMLAGRALFWDLDVEPGNPLKYETQADAIRDLARFLKEAQMPPPLLISSGGGLHVYWRMADDIPVAEWVTHAANLYKLGQVHGVRIDPSRTTDITSVLRVAGTSNLKPNTDGTARVRPVEMLADGVILPNAELIEKIDHALIRAGEMVKVAPTPISSLAASFGSNTQSNAFHWPAPELLDVAASCAQVQEMIRRKGDFEQTAWYRGMLATIKFVKDGEAWCRKITSFNPRTNSDIDAKLKQLDKYGPARCETLRAVMPAGDAPCQSCRFLNDPTVPNPIVAARRTAQAPPPVVMPLAVPGMVSAPLPIPDAPAPYVRLKTGEIARVAENADGEMETNVVFPYDLYPVRRMVTPEGDYEQQLWHVDLPRDSKDFTLDADALYDSRKFTATIANHGLYPNKSNLPYLQDYMVAYISRLQAEVDAELQRNHFGWSANYEQFTLPDKVLHADGTQTPTLLGLKAQRAGQHLGKKGTLAAQVALMAFYKSPVYIPSQFLILCSLGAPIYYGTGLHGVVVNASGESGSSKSTTLSTCASAWGHPTLLPINGTNRGATANARLERPVVFANIPTCVDEITHLPIKEVQDLVMGVTQPGGRVRLNTDGTEKKTPDSYKSTMMLATANTSLHGVLSTDNSAGTAGSMRVVELVFRKNNAHQKHEADEFKRQLEENYGHLGEAFMAYVVQHRAEVEKRVQAMMREIDTLCKIQPAERFWSGSIAAALVAGEIAFMLGLVPYDIMAIKTWCINTLIPSMRGIVLEEYSDPLAILTDYLATIHGNIIIVNQLKGFTQQGPAFEANALTRPMGALLGHYDVDDKIMYVLKKGFKDYCTRIGANPTRILIDLAVARPNAAGTLSKIISDPHKRVTLGAGTIHSIGQQWCFVVNMGHPDISGVVALEVLQGGGKGGTPAANLTVVP